MAPRLAGIVLERIEDAIRHELKESNTPPPDCFKQIATSYKCSLRTVYRHYRRIQRNQPRGGHLGGACKVITFEVETAIRQLLDEKPWFYQDEIRDFLIDVFDIHVNQSTISRALQRIKYTRKVLRVAAGQRNTELRTDWLDQLQLYNAEQFVFVDESGSDERTGDRVYGYALSGHRAVVSRWLANRTRISVLPAYTVDGYIASITFPGTCNGELFST